MQNSRGHIYLNLTSGKYFDDVHNDHDERSENGDGQSNVSNEIGEDDEFLL